MATKNIYKITRQQSVVGAIGSGNTTISIYELAYSDQTVDAANVKVNITHAYFTLLNGAANVIRNGNVVLALTEGQESWRFSEEVGFNINKDVNANIFIDFGTTYGTIILGLTKEAGYIDPDRQNLQPWER